MTTTAQPIKRGRGRPRKDPNAPPVRKTSASKRDYLYDEFQMMIKEITGAELKALVRNGVAKGDAQVLRVLASMAGVDLSERPTSSNAEGAMVIMIKDHPLEAGANDE